MKIETEEKKKRLHWWEKSLGVLHGLLKKGLVAALGEKSPTYDFFDVRFNQAVCCCFASERES
jgi:hypothetical protein